MAKGILTIDKDALSAIHALGRSMGGAVKNNGLDASVDFNGTSPRKGTKAPGQTFNPET